MYDANWEKFIQLTQMGTREQVEKFLATLNKKEIIRIIIQKTYGYDRA